MKKQNIQSGSAHLVIVIILALALIGALGFVFWQNFMQPKVNKSQDSSLIKTATDSKYQQISQSELEPIVTGQLSLLNGKTSIDQITNQEKLQLAANLYAKDHPYANGVYSRTIAASDIEDILNKSSISTDKLIHESIECVTATNPVHNEYEYNTSTKTYSNANHGGHGIENQVYAVYSKTSNFKENNGQYSISYKYVFGVLREFGADNDSVFGTYSDAKNNTNPIHTFVADININNGVVDPSTEPKYIEQNYNSFENKLLTYIYTFEKIDSKIKLVSFSVN